MTTHYNFKYWQIQHIISKAISSFSNCQNSKQILGCFGRFGYEKKIGTFLFIESEEVNVTSDAKIHELIQIN